MKKKLNLKVDSISLLNHKDMAHVKGGFITFLTCHIVIIAVSLEICTIKNSCNEPDCLG